ncbi:hypothetical protein CHLRE_04g224800v5 [Chlamydomonas reinhardtii]|uniref:Uncharacterized protein n=1 Tax=Chlamydomonas reinhardtii TaxID=3055 RepID=A8IT49_CHLRE|nr:uncharacterized protein CHLRE_04g224800v5 [Chlamydomonas reinhardtii]PNW84188.1 hypothetical protein CHLRE_04g224800v5 [Chlamydomonas reinhardtii]|eukprot:XP_001692312.1 R-SNARE protein, VAMP72-family [Chlamydomonas reinhardtii]
MPLVYVSVCQGSVALAEYAGFQGNFAVVARDYLDKATKLEGKSRYEVDGHSLNFLNRGGFTYLVIASVDSGVALPSAFLDKVEAEFRAKYGAGLQLGAAAGSLNATFGKQLKQLTENATQHPEEFSKVAAVQKKVDEAKAVMVDNIDAVLKRGEKLEQIQEKTEDLMAEADRFRDGAVRVKRKLWWQNCKMKIVVALAVILLAVVIFLLVCFSGGNCLK